MLIFFWFLILVGNDLERLVLKYFRNSDLGFWEHANTDKTGVSLIQTLLHQSVVPDEYLLKTCQEQTARTQFPTTWKEQLTAASLTKFFGSDVAALLTSVLVNIKLEDNKEKKKTESTHEKKL